ncbi:hypothetical protein JOM56_001074 [Amanita muscaria]
MISYTEASVIATTLRAILFGIYMSTFFYCLRWLVFMDEGWTKRKDIKWGILTVTFVIFALSTADFGINLKGTLLSAAEGFHSWSVLSLIVESLMTIIIDSVLIYRCWIVWNKSWRIVSGLLLLLLCNVVLLAVLTYWGILELEAEEGLFYVEIIHLHEAFLTCTIVIDVYATSVIILQMQRNCITQHLLHFATRIIAESGLSYTLTSLMFLCAISIDDAPADLRMITQAIRYPITGITFNVILIRVAHHRADENTRPWPPLEFITFAENSLPNDSPSQSSPV